MLTGTARRVVYSGRRAFTVVSPHKPPPMNVNHFQKTIAITREIDDSLVQSALTMNPGSQQSIDLELARKQHAKLSRELKWVGLQVHTIGSAGFPDSVFIEDTAIVIGRTVMITNPGARSRRGEVMGVRKYLKENFAASENFSETIDVVDLPGDGTVDGGDILFTGRAIIAGLSARTNQAGIDGIRKLFPHLQVIAVDLAQLTAHARKNAALSGTHAPVEDVLHLKSFCSMCSEDIILTGGELGLALQRVLRREIDKPQFIHVPDVGAANCVYVNQTLIRRSRTEFPNSEAIFRQQVPKYIRHVEVEAGELAKVDGALTCCSLLLKV